MTTIAWNQRGCEILGFYGSFGSQRQTKISLSWQPTTKIATWWKGVTLQTFSFRMSVVVLMTSLSLPDLINITCCCHLFQNRRKSCGPRIHRSDGFLAVILCVDVFMFLFQLMGGSSVASPMQKSKRSGDSRFLLAWYAVYTFYMDLYICVVMYVHTCR